MGTVVAWLGGLSGPVVYAVVAALVFCEDAIFVGFVFPGETAAVLGGVLAGQGKVAIVWLTTCVVAAAIVGDSVGYAIGNRYGARIFTVRPLRRHAERIEKAQDLIRRHGAEAVFLGRFVAFFRALMPAIAGVVKVPYRKFLLFNALGGLVWGVGYTLLGYFAGRAYTRIEADLGRGLALGIAAFVVIGLIIGHFRRRRREKNRSETTPPAC